MKYIFQRFLNLKTVGIVGKDIFLFFGGFWEELSICEHFANNNETGFYLLKA